jgi:integrase
MAPVIAILEQLNDLSCWDYRINRFDGWRQFFCHRRGCYNSTEKLVICDRVGKRFQSYGLPFVPYDLRHAHAIRGSVVFQLPVAVMAELMGHSPELHFSTYDR